MTSPLQQQKEMLGHLIIVCRTSTESIFQMVRFYFCVRLSRPSARKCKRKLLFSHAGVCVVRTKKTKKNQNPTTKMAIAMATLIRRLEAGGGLDCRARRVDPPAASASLELASPSSRGS